MRTPGLNTWETNFIPDLSNLHLQAWDERGGGSSNIMLIMSDGTMHAHVSEMPVGTYKKAHRHGPDFHVYCVKGEGFSIFWYEGMEDEMIRFDWKHGWVFAPGDQMFHLHFNKGGEPCRYYASALGSRRYPFNERKEVMYRGEQPKNMKIDGAQLEYTEQPTDCHLAFLIEMEKRGISSRMGKYLDEANRAAQSGRQNRENRLAGIVGVIDVIKQLHRDFPRALDLHEAGCRSAFCITPANSGRDSGDVGH